MQEETRTLIFEIGIFHSFTSCEEKLLNMMKHTRSTTKNTKNTFDTHILGPGEHTAKKFNIFYNK